MAAPSASGPPQHNAGQDLLATVYCSVALVVISHLLLASWHASCQFVRQNYNSEGEMSCQRDVTQTLLRPWPYTR